MIFSPTKSKYKKNFKGKIFNQLYKNIKPNSLHIGNIGLKAVEHGFLNTKHFYSIKQSVRKIIKKVGRIFFLNFPQLPKTNKPLAMRMGKGKGNVEDWICKFQPGMIICELNTLNLALGIKALTTAKFRLPIKSKLTFEK